MIQAIGDLSNMFPALTTAFTAMSLITLALMIMRTLRQYMESDKSTDNEKPKKLEGEATVILDPELEMWVRQNSERVASERTQDV